MPHTLLVFIPDQPQLDATTPAGWTLLGADDAALRSGSGPLAAAPRAERVVAVAPVSHILYLETALPPVSVSKRDALLRYAIEDKLTIDPATVHAVVLGKASGDSHVIAAIDRAWLADALHWLRAAGLTADALLSSAAAVPVAADTWSAVLAQPKSFAKRADGFVHHFDLGSMAETPFALTLALKEAHDKQRAPRALTLFGDAGDPGAAPTLDAALCRAWGEKLALPVTIGQAGAAAAPRALLARIKAENLLTGEFAPAHRGRAWLTAFRPVLLGLALLIGIHLVLSLVENRRLDAARGRLEEELKNLFRQSFPAAQAIVDPALQLQRNLDQAKRERGLGGGDPARLAVARLTRVVQGLSPSPGVLSLQLADGEVALEVQLASAAQAELLRTLAARERDLSLAIRVDAKTQATVARLGLRSGR